jgi:ribosomal protein S18 acetylase RimI-like enzyme
MIHIGPWNCPAELDAAADLLYEAVHGGASVSFILPFTLEDARAFWRKVADQHAAQVLVARLDSRVAGIVILDLDTPPNQAHRAEVKKLLVHPGYRRRGIGRSLMTAVEAAAHRAGRSLLTLDTRTGDHAEPLYLSMGYTLAGVIPDFARGPASPQLESTSILYKRIA